MYMNVCVPKRIKNLLFKLAYKQQTPMGYISPNSEIVYIPLYGRSVGDYKRVTWDFK